MNNIVYIADIDQDIDDLIAVDYLHQQNFLKYMVLDNEPETALAKERMGQLIQKGIRVEEQIQDGAKILFVGGSLKKVRQFLQRNEENHVPLLVMNGGFVGSNIVQDDQALKKFKGELFARTYNFNLDTKSTEYILGSEKIDQIYLIGKNVCHHEQNTTAGIWKEHTWLNQYKISSKKRLHDLLAVDEGIKLLRGNTNDCRLLYETIKVLKMRTETEDKFTRWGSERTEKSRVSAAVGWKTDVSCDSL